MICENYQNKDEKIKDEFMDAFIKNELSKIINILDMYPDFDTNDVYNNLVRPIARAYVHSEKDNLFTKERNNIAKILLQNEKFNINHKQYPLLDIAVYCNNLELVMILLDDPRIDFSISVCIAIICNNIIANEYDQHYKILKLLLSKQEIPIYYDNQFKQSKQSGIASLHPLLYPIYWNNIDLLTILLDDVRIQNDSYLINAICKACERKKYDIIKILWNIPYIQSKINDIHFKAHLIASISDAESIDLITFMLELTGLNIISEIFETLIFDNAFEIAFELLDKYCDQIDIYESTLLNIAQRLTRDINFSSKLVYRLLENPKININFQNESFQTALHICFIALSTIHFNTMLESSCKDPEQTCSHFKLIKILLKSPHIDLDLKDEDGKTPVDLICKLAKIDQDRIYQLISDKI